MLFNDSCDYNVTYRIAQEQSVVGLITAGISLVENIKIPQNIKLQLVGETLQIENRNKEMNAFVARLLKKLQDYNISTFLVKGQGIAQCYEKPLWRTCGDVDLLADEDNYKKAHIFLKSLSSNCKAELSGEKHIEYEIESWTVELHGNLPSRLFKRIDRRLFEIQKSIGAKGLVRVWHDEETDILMLSPDEDVIFVFTHLLKHFFHGGVGLRQICDWVRLIWTFRDIIDKDLLETRIRNMGILTEWRVFAYFAVNKLGMPSESMPLYENKNSLKIKSEKISSFILNVGNMGHNRDTSFYVRYPYVIRKAISLYRQCDDLLHHAMIFPIDSLRLIPSVVFNGLISAVRME